MRPETIRFGILGIMAIFGAAALWPEDPNSSGPPSAPTLRAQALGLCGLYLPCTRGDAHYEEICKDFGGIGTTCGYLPAFIYDRLGCRDPGLVNRADAAAGLVYRIGENIADVVNGGKNDGMWRLYDPSTPPQPGDVLYFGVVDSNGGISHEHVAICVSFPSGGNGNLVTYDLGHSIQPEGSMSTRSMTSDGTVQFLGTTKRLIGIDDLSKLPITATADLTDHTLANS